MQDFPAVLAAAALAQAVSDTAGTAEKTTAQRLVAELAVSCPETINDVALGPLTAFLAVDGTDTVHATTVARALCRSARQSHQQLLVEFLNRPELSLAVIESFVSTDTAPMLATGSTRPDVLELVHAKLGPDLDVDVFGGLALNPATPAELRVRVISRLLNMYNLELADTVQSYVGMAIQALRIHPDALQPVFDSLNLPPATLLTLYANDPAVWKGLSVEQLDRLVTVFAQVMSVDASGLSAVADLPLAWRHCSWKMLMHPCMTAHPARRMVAAVDAVYTPTSDPDLLPWLEELTEIAEILAAPNRLAALLKSAYTEVLSLNGWRLAVLISASATDLVAVLTDPGGHRYIRGEVIRNLVKHGRLERCTPELLSLLPVASFLEWRARTHDQCAVNTVFAELMFSRLGPDLSAWRIFAELAELADDDATVAEVAALAASLSTDQ